MALNASFTDLAQKIQNDYAAGVATRASLGTKGVAFGWAAGLPVTCASHLSVMQIEGRSVPIGSVSPTVTPPAVVAPRGPKPNAVSVAVAPATLSKFAGVGDCSTEDLLDAQGLIPAIAQVLSAGCLMAFEEAAIGIIDTATTITASGTTWQAGILTAQGKVLANGGSPGLIIVSALDYAAVIGELANGPGFSVSPESAIGQLWGSRLHISSKAPAGKLFVMDPSAFVVIESADSPMALVDPFSKSANNVTQVVVDLLATVAPVNPLLSVEVTKTAVAAQGARK